MYSVSAIINARSFILTYTKSRREAKVIMSMLERLRDDGANMVSYVFNNKDTAYRHFGADAFRQYVAFSIDIVEPRLDVTKLIADTKRIYKKHANDVGVPTNE